MRSLKLRTLAATAAFCGSAAFAQVVNIDQPVVNLADGPVNVAATFDLPIGMGPAQNLADFAALSRGLAFYTARYPAFGAFLLPFNIVGTDPSLGANTTTIPTVLVPLRFVFPNAGNPTLDGTNVIAATKILRSSSPRTTWRVPWTSASRNMAMLSSAGSSGTWRGSRPPITCSS